MKHRVRTTLLFSSVILATTFAQAAVAPLMSQDEPLPKPLQSHADHAGLPRVSQLGDQLQNIVFIFDGSDSITSTTFRLEQTSIIACLCGPDAWIPANGTVAVCAIQFLEGANVVVPLTLVDSPATAQAICATINTTPQFGALGTYLRPALDEAYDILTASTANAAPQVFVLTDAIEYNPSSALEGCYNLRALSPPAKICSALVGWGLPWRRWLRGIPQELRQYAGCDAV